MLSIVIINLNNCYGLYNTLSSLQKRKNLEVVLIDGSSTDKSLEVIEKFSEIIDVFISEKDSGIYNAMNKGIRLAHGEYVLMLNSGDSLWQDDIIERFINLDPPPIEDIIYGNVMWEENGKQFIGKFPDKLTFNYFLHQALGHQAMFVKRSLLEKMGYYREDYTIVSDWAFEVDALVKHNAKFRYWDEIISLCHRDGISCKPESQKIIDIERSMHLSQNYSMLLPDYKNHINTMHELSAIKNRKVFRILKKLGLS
jgi:glycosyltransferase involved in cell wall biosynthesis